MFTNVLFEQLLTVFSSWLVHFDMAVLNCHGLLKPLPVCRIHSRGYISYKSNSVHVHY